MLQTENATLAEIPFTPAAVDQLISEAWQEAERRIRLGIYEPFGACAKIQQLELPEIVISGPAGTGKSRACLEKIHHLASTCPGSRYLIVRKTRASLTESALQTFEQWVLGSDHPMLLGGPQRRFRQNYRYPNGSEITIGGLDRPSRIMSTEYDVVFVQEAIELDEDGWEALTTRLRNNVLPFQQLIADTNPSFPTHWLKQRCDQGATKMLDSRHEDNPRLWDHDTEKWTPEGVEYIGKLDRLTGARKQRLRFGKWVQAEGVIHENYDPAIHLIDRFDMPEDWPRFRVVDFGFTNPFVCQWWALDDDGRMYRYREIYMTQRTVKVHSVNIAELSKNENFSITVCDHDAEDMATLRENGIETIPARKAVSVGLQRVSERLKIADDDRPRIFFLRDSVAEVDQLLVDDKKPWVTEQEFEGYVWSKKATKEEPVKLNDHGMDALRYAVMYVDGDLSDWLVS